MHTDPLKQTSVKTRDVTKSTQEHTTFFMTSLQTRNTKQNQQIQLQNLSYLQPGS